MKENWTTGFERTSFSSSGAIRPTSTKAEARLLKGKQKPESEVGHIALDKERIVLSKPVVQFSFTYGVLKYFIYLFMPPFYIISVRNAFIRNIINRYSLWNNRLFKSNFSRWSLLLKPPKKVRSLKELK